MNTDIVVTVYGRDSADLGRKIESIDAIANHRMPPAIPNDPVLPLPAIPNVPVIDPPPAPPIRKPWFSIGSAEGKVGDTVEVPVLAGCPIDITGFHIGGGLGGPTNNQTGNTGYGTLLAKGCILGDYLRDYLTGQGMFDSGKASFFEIFQMATWAKSKALPEEWWDYAVAFFSIKDEGFAEPVSIPSGTELFRIEIEILEPSRGRGRVPLSCEDNRYYTQDNSFRRDFEWTRSPQSITDIETEGGYITVVE